MNGKDNQTGVSADDFTSKSVPISISLLNLKPSVDCGKYPIKRIVGDRLRVTVEALRPGHEKIAVFLNFKMANDGEWHTIPMKYSSEQDLWSEELVLKSLGVAEYFVEAWLDEFSTKLDQVRRWIASGEDESEDVQELVKIINEAAENSSSEEKKNIINSRLELLQKERSLIPERENRWRDSALAFFGDHDFAQAVISSLKKKECARSQVFAVIVDREKAVYSSWYEMFHRSQGNVEGKSATFADCKRRLSYVKELGFDVIYLPPIHPIGKTNRRGRNNRGPAKESEPGSPWATGNEEGGHYSVNPELGTMDEFLDFVEEARKMGIEIAIDLALQVSPDHPYVREHPDWFRRRESDGEIKYAENPPKKYYDIYPLDFSGQAWRDLWQEASKIVAFWSEKGIRIFRVDNPHTKPLAMWQWLLASTREKYPDIIFLAEAFTRPKTMKLLSKVGFDQSYTYFAWKNAKWELEEFLKEFIISQEAQEYYRGNFFTNTPDILSEYLQNGGKPAFKIRAALASTISSAWGIYNGFELCENRARTEGSEEYLDSEKYQYKVWDWDRRENIRDYISRLNAIRRENEALQNTSNLRIVKTESDFIISYAKWTRDLSNRILAVINLDPFSAHETWLHVPIEEIGIKNDEKYMVKDLITGSIFEWYGSRNYVRLDPSVEPAHVLQFM